MAAAVRAIRGFHAAEVPALPRVSNAEANDSASDAVTDLETACPDLHEPLNEIRRRLPEGLEEEDNGDSVTLHNDLHWNQFSIKGGRFAILDLERMARGDATVDVANFATQLQMLGCRPDIDVDQETADRWRKMFLTCWEADAGRPLPRARFHALAARSRLELARGMLRHLRPDWPAIVEECVVRSVGDVARINSGEDIL
jgi:aminoglycoside phosphotransferase (APT) family kinase protein